MRALSTPFPFGLRGFRAAASPALRMTLKPETGNQELETRRWFSRPGVCRTIWIGAIVVSAVFVLVGQGFV